MQREALHAELGLVLERLRAMEARGEVRLSERARTWAPDALVDRVMRAFVGYHRKTILTEQDGGVIIEDPALCLYYQNRMNAYAERVADDANLPFAREIARLG